MIVRTKLPGLKPFERKFSEINCDASRISAGVHFRESAPAGRNHSKHFQNLPTVCSKSQKSSKNFSPNPPKTFAKRAKIHPEALLEPILGKCLKEVRFWTFKKRPRGDQKHPKEAQDDPKPLPNRAQDLPQIDFDWIFGRFLSSFKFAKIFPLFFHYVLWSEPLKTMVFPQ